MLGKDYQPCTRKELMQRLYIEEQNAPVFHHALDKLVKQGVIESVRGRYRWVDHQAETMTGIIRVHHRGFGFVQADNAAKYPQDIFIPKHLTQFSVDGDHVEVQVDEEAVSEKGPEGKVVAILKRGRTHIAGTVTRVGADGYFSAYVPLLGQGQDVVGTHPGEESLRVGDRVILHVTQWGDQGQSTECELSHIIGHLSDPSCDVAAACEEYNIRSDFPRKVIQEAKAYGNRVTLKDIKEREDLRGRETFTIDPDTAKDFDDALSLHRDAEGHYHLAVHIADVTHYVRPDSALDVEAQLRCNSTYFPGECIPMLPADLSNNLCSLKPNVNRLAVTVLMVFDERGVLQSQRTARTVIKSQKRFTYREAKEVLDGTRRSKHKPTLDLMVELCGLLKEQRRVRGSVEFALPEYSVRVDATGQPTGVEVIEYDITHQLVEEFMLKANEAVATHLTQQGLELTYRVHEEPAADNLKDFAATVAAFGFQLPVHPEAADIQGLFKEIVDSPFYDYLASCYIRCMRLACYSPINQGHFGLSLENYCHFTSPIRRYADVIVHRVLLGGNLESDTLHKLSRAISDQERISAKAEGSVTLLKKLRLLEQAPADSVYEAVITRIKPFGLFFELKEMMVEGFLHVSNLEDDYFAFQAKKQELEGESTGLRFASGDSLGVCLDSVDLIRLETEWRLASHAERRPPGRGRRGRKRRRR